MIEKTITFPVGRALYEHLYDPQIKEDDNGNPVLDDKGQKILVYKVGVAYAKNPGETDWKTTTWGQKIVAFALSSWPGGQTAYPSFAWKVADGDSTVPNKVGKTNVSKEGYAGHWVIHFSTNYPPILTTADGQGILHTKNAIEAGYYVQVVANLGAQTTGKGLQNPGVFINPDIVALSAYGEKITKRIDPKLAGLGGAPLPPGASLTPITSLTPPAAPVNPAAPYVPSAPTPPAPPVPAAPPSTFAVLIPPPVPVVPPTPTMTAKAGGGTYAQFIASGWTDELLRAQGFIV